MIVVFMIEGTSSGQCSGDGLEDIGGCRSALVLCLDA